MISIIVPIYNSGRWLRRCIESLISQTYKNIEILLINDGSSDDSLNICREYALKDNRIVVINKENEGVSATRNLGIKSAKGEFIQFVDSDDYLDMNACQSLLNIIEGCDMAICGMRIWKNNKVLREPQVAGGVIELREDINNYLDLRKINLGPCNKLYRVKKVYTLFDENISLGEDTLFVLNYMRNVERIGVVQECLYNVVLDNENSLNKKQFDGKLDMLLRQRQKEEDVLIELYGENSQINLIYTYYLCTVHAAFISSMKLKKEFISKYTNDIWLREKIKRSNPDRWDYKIFRLFFLKKKNGLIKFYFIMKQVLIKTKLRK